MVLGKVVDDGYTGLQMRTFVRDVGCWKLAVMYSA